MEVKIETKDYNILASGSVIVPSKDYVTISFDGLNFRFSFVNDDADKEKSKFDVHVIKNDKEENVLEIVLHNMNNTFFGTPNKMLQVGRYNGFVLYLQFSLVGLKVEDNYAQQLLFYTFYQDKTKKD